MDSKHYFITCIPKELKRKCLVYLNLFYNIHVRTIYNDLSGYIENEKRWKSAHILFIKGLAESRSGNYSKAIEYYCESIEHNPDAPNVWFNLGNSRCELEEFQEAIYDYDQAIELNSNFADAWNNRGIAHLDLKKYSDAKKDFENCIELKQRNADYLRNRGIANKFLRKLNDSYFDFERSRELAREQGAPESEAKALAEIEKLRTSRKK